MRKIICAVFSATLILTSIFVNAQVGKMLGAQGQRYNEKNASQGFVYDLNVDSTNTIVGSIIQENKSPDKDWCAYLKVTAMRKDKSTIAVFATPPHNLEAKGKSDNAKVFSQNVKWKLNENCFEFNIEAVTSCTPMKGQ
ncbi:MAG: hypothetical protein ACHQNT_02675 [Bacteroidia bacterium]